MSANLPNLQSGTPSTDQWSKGLATRFLGWLFGTPRPTAPLEPVKKRYYQKYRARRKSLPIAFGAADWARALDYWGNCCAVCDRPRGLWHTISQDHWIPLTDPNCPGTVPTNMLPLCYGDNGCNNSKGKKNPELWLLEKLGRRKAKEKLDAIHQFFVWTAEQNGTVYAPGSTPCPDCSYPLTFVEGRNQWHCDKCKADWKESEEAEEAAAASTAS